MDIKISYNWLNEYLKTRKSPADFSREMSLRCQSVERLHEQKPKFQGVITAKIIEIAKHPNADKLRLPTVDTGKEKLQIVCGAPNIEPGQIVPLALEGAILGVGSEEFKIKKTNIRGVDSNGMLCSAKELGLGDDHSGIFILPANTPIGHPLEKVMPLSDTILDIEVTSNRPDAMSVIGLAREGAAALGQKFEFKPVKPDLKVKENIALEVKLEEPKTCLRYQAIVMTDVKVGPSPLWMQSRLIASGLRPINNLVDITNYILLEYGQPLHVFDYDKLSGKKIIVRKARPNEKILALDGKTYDLKPENLVIADAQKPVAVAGVMGGQETAAEISTKTIVFEAANFNPVSVRKTARALNLYSDSSSLYEKGLHPQNTYFALMAAVLLAQKLSGAKVASKVFDLGAKTYKPSKIKFDLKEVKRILGVEIPATQVKKILTSLGFKVAGNKILNVTIPWFRATDVVYDYDLVEEVARIYGYHNLATTLPTGTIPTSAKDPVLVWEKEIKNYLLSLGLTEIVSYSMVPATDFSKARLDIEKAIKLYNPLNEDMEYMRTSLVPGILKCVSDNQKTFSEIKIFELSNIYPLQKVNDLPNEAPRLVAAISGAADNFLSAKGLALQILGKMGLSEIEFKTSDHNFFEPNQGLEILVDKKSIGSLGVVSADLQEAFSLDSSLAIIDFDFKLLSSIGKQGKTYRLLPAFPESYRDLSVVIGRNVKWAEITLALSNISPILFQVQYLSTFTDESLGESQKSLAFRLVFRSSERTLKSEEVDEAVKKIITILEKEFGAKLR